MDNPGVGMALEKDDGRYKLFTSDAGLFVTLAFKDKKYTENVIYNKLLSDKLDANLGYVYENAVAQMLIAKGDNIFYYTMESDTSNHLYDIEFYYLGCIFIFLLTDILSYDNISTVRQTSNKMREWLSWWSTTLPRLGSRVRVPSRASFKQKEDIREDIFFLFKRGP